MQQFEDSKFEKLPRMQKRMFVHLHSKISIIFTQGDDQLLGKRSPNQNDNLPSIINVYTYPQE